MKISANVSGVSTGSKPAFGNYKRVGWYYVNKFVDDVNAVKTFTTSNNECLLKATDSKRNPHLGLDMFLTQNMEIGRDEINDISGFRKFVLSKLSKVSFPEKFIGHPKTAIASNLSNAILTKEKIRLIPDDCRMNSSYYFMFPRYKRYNIRQGAHGDCYFLATLDALMKKPKGEDYLSALFVKQRDESLHFEVKKKVDNEIVTKKVSVNGIEQFILQLGGLKGAISPKWVKFFEVGYSKLSKDELLPLYKKYNLPVHKDYEKSKLLGSYWLSGRGQDPQIAMDVLGLDNIKSSSHLWDEFGLKFDMAQPQRISVLTTNVNVNPKVAEEYDGDIIGNHAYSMNGYDFQRNKFKVSNPHNSAVELMLDYKTLKEEFREVATGDVPEYDLWRHPYNPDEYIRDYDAIESMWQWYT